MDETALSTIREIERMLPMLTRAEKAQLLKWVAQDLGDDCPGIESTQGVCGGDARVVRTRIPVWLLERTRRLGATDEKLLRAYPSLHDDIIVQILGQLPAATILIYEGHPTLPRAEKAPARR